MERSPLSRLPAEIRNFIYELVLVQSDPINTGIEHYYSNLPRYKKSTRLALCLVCKQAASEALSVFYSGNIFEFHITSSWFHLFKAIRICLRGTSRNKDTTIVQDARITIYQEIELDDEDKFKPFAADVVAGVAPILDLLKQAGGSLKLSITLGVWDEKKIDGPQETWDLEFPHAGPARILRPDNIDDIYDRLYDRLCNNAIDEIWDELKAQHEGSRLKSPVELATPAGRPWDFLSATMASRASREQ